MPSGKVKFFNEQKGYGFIAQDDGSGDIFVHKTGLQIASDLLEEGDAVTFDVDTDERKGKTHAINVRLAA